MKYSLRLILLFLLTSTMAFAQQKTVKGVVMDPEFGEPVIGATVVVKGHPTVGAISDVDGNFSLSVPDGATHVIVTAIGFKPQEVAIKDNMVVNMGIDETVLKEVEVVSTGMYNVDKRLITGASANIDASKAKIDGVADISRSLEGRAAGVSVQNVSGTFGSAPKIRVRGATSIYGNSRPLWVVDGVIMEDNIDVSSDDLSSGNAETLIASAIAGLNADDIESFNILKDGSATSIYGARAMAGVIVVTTKKGKAGVSRISYTGEFTSRLKPNYRDFNITNSQEQMGIYSEMEQKGWLEFAGIYGNANTGVYGKMYELINTYENGEYALENTRNAKNAYLRQSEYINTDWFDELFQTNLMHNHAVSISSGTDKAQFYMSLSAMFDPGWTLSNSVERYTFNANGSYDLSSNLTLKLSGMGSRRDQLAPGTLSKETDVVSGEINRGFDINPYNYALTQSRTLDPNETYTRNYAPFNIFHELDNNYIDLKVTDVKFQGELNWKILKGWSANALGSIRYSESSQEHHIKDKSNMAMAYRAGVKEGELGEVAIIRESNRYLYKDPENPNALPETVLPNGGIYKLRSNSLKDMYLRLSTSYANDFAEKHIVNFFGGMDVQSTQRQNVWFEGWGYQYDMGGLPYFDYKLFKQYQEGNTAYYGNQSTIYNNVAFFGTGTYSYLRKYVLNGTLRYEGSNKMGKSRQARWLPTWNVSGAWNAHEESWFENPVLSHGTLKASYSLTAESGPVSLSNALPIYRAVTIWRPNSSLMEKGLRLVSTQNSQLTFEKKHELNLGVDLGLAKDRIGLTVDYFVRNQFDLVGQLYTTGVGGGDIVKYANVADMTSGGVEVGIFSKNIKTKNFSWETNFFFTNTYTEITKLQSDAKMISLVAGTGFPWQGYPVRALFSIQFDGLNEEGLPTFINENGEKTISSFWFQEDDQEKLTKNLKYEGPIDPTIYGSLSNVFNYKNFSLNVFLTYSFGNYVRLDPTFSVAYSDLTAMPREFMNRWTLPGDEKYTNVPVIASRRQYGNVDNLSYAYTAYNYSTERVAKGDFIRLKEVSLGYDFPKNITQKMKLGNLALKLQATNLFLLYADKKLNGQDPEFANSGGVAVPMPKQFTLTLRIGL